MVCKEKGDNQDRGEGERKLSRRDVWDTLMAEFTRGARGFRYYGLLVWFGGFIILWVVLLSAGRDPDPLDALETLALLVVGILVLLLGLKAHWMWVRNVDEALRSHRTREERLEEERRKAVQEADKGKGSKQEQTWAGQMSTGAGTTQPLPRKQ